MSEVLLGLLAGAGAAVALLLAWPAPVRWPPAGSPAAGVVGREDRPQGWTAPRRRVVAVLAGCAVPVLVPGPLGLGLAVPAAVVAATVLARVEPVAVRHRREALRHDLPHVVSLLAAALRAGAATEQALRVVARALPGPAAERLAGVAARLELGADPEAAWAEAAVRDPALAPLARGLARAHRSGASVATAVERLADELAAEARAQVEDRARAVGVKAAVPLGLCLLPAFVLVGIVPLVAGLMVTVL